MRKVLPCGLILISLVAVRAQTLTIPRDSALTGSIPAGEVVAGEISLTIEDALARGLKYNLALVQNDLDTRFQRSERLHALSDLLPRLSIRPAVTEQQVNLASFGFSGIPGVPSIIGPFTVYDARAYGSASVLNIHDLRTYRATGESIQAAQLSYRDTRDQVVLVVVALYLQAIASSARIDSARAQVATSQTLYQQAADRKNAGVVPAIDVVRSQVELQAQQQRLISYEGDFEKAKITLARAIGLPPGQHFRLADVMSYRPLPASVNLAETLDQAYRMRADYQAAQARVRAAELRKQAARAERYPSAAIEANYGTIGSKINETHGTFAVTGSVNIPLFQGHRTEADILEADVDLQRERAQLDNLRGRIDSDVRTAFVDISSASRQVEVARGNAELAREQLTQSQDRFAAGVTNNLEVVQAQEAVAGANENYISSLYAFNIASGSSPSI